MAFTHRSVYCSCDDDCDADAATLRDGTLGLESLLARHRVDLLLNGHEHNYERMYAVFNSTLVTGASSGAPGGNASAPEVVTNPAATIYIVSGCAGDVEQHEPFTRAQPAYSAFRSNTFGFGVVTFFNASHLLWTATQTDTGQPATTGSVIDAMMLVRSAGAPGW